MIFDDESQTGEPLPEWRILLIDDDEDEYCLTRMLVKETKGYRVSLDWAATYSNGKEMITANNYDAVLVDYDLGSRTGIEFIQEVAASGYKAPLILYTGRGSYETDMEAMKAGADLYLTKSEVTPLIFERSIRYVIKHKKIEGSLRESEARFRALVTATTSYAVYRMSPDWSEMSQLHGPNFLASTEKPNSEWQKEYILPEDQAHVMSVIKEAIRNKRNFELEHRVKLANGEVGWTFSRAVPVMDSEGEIHEWFGVAYDITDRKWIEEKLKFYAEQLECVKREI